MLKRILYFLIFSCVFTECQAQCSGTSCRECISSGYSCSWCLQKNFTEERCQTQSALLQAGCIEDEVEHPKVSMLILKDSPVTDSGSGQPAVQIQPQLVRLTTRPRKESTIPLKFRAANDYPVDLYFLFDISWTMMRQVESLGKLAKDIGQSIGQISRNYRMGYGVFQDKVIMPFTDTSPEKMINPCEGSKTARVCATPFEFKHLLTMTNDVETFENQVIRTNLTGNLDHPEGSADAIMQAVSCKSEIGWRAISRKLLIFASNDRFHLAGDGRLAGIVIPNDGLCHLDSKGKYSMELEQDYPSVGQLADVVEKNEVHIIFAVPNDYMDLYKSLSHRIPQSIVEVLANPDEPSNRNIRDIIEKKYREMISEVKIVHDDVENVDIQIQARSEECERDNSRDRSSGNLCKGIKIGSEINFDVHIKVRDCPKNPEDRIKRVVFHPESLKRDQLVVEIETICECGCDSDETTWVKDSDLCTGGNGTLKCGQCDCNEDRFGQFCECDASESDSMNSGCINPADNSTVECSGAGLCECGVCKCEEGYSGPFCQCNDNACGSYRREICGGRGKCSCGECVCDPTYTGSTCECSTSNHTCIQNGILCNDIGTCECGECKCKEGFVGVYCEECFLCGDVCDIRVNRDCAQCALEEADIDCPEDCPETKLVDHLSSNDSNVCSVKQSDGCFISFHVMTIDTNVTILVQKTTTCPAPVNLAPIIGGVVGGVVAAGLFLLLLWKIITMTLDKREYSKFQEDLKHCKWAQQDNPFYKGATTTYKNPMMNPDESADDINMT